MVLKSIDLDRWSTILWQSWEVLMACGRPSRQRFSRFVNVARFDVKVAVRLYYDLYSGCQVILIFLSIHELNQSRLIHEWDSVVLNLHLEILGLLNFNQWLAVDLSVTTFDRNLRLRVVFIILGERLIRPLFLGEKVNLARVVVNRLAVVEFMFAYLTLDVFSVQ